MSTQQDKRATEKQQHICVTTATAETMHQPEVTINAYPADLHLAHACGWLLSCHVAGLPARQHSRLTCSEPGGR